MIAETDSQQRLAFGDGWRADARDEEAGFAELGGELHGAGGVADDEGDDLRARTLTQPSPGERGLQGTLTPALSRRERERNGPAFVAEARAEVAGTLEELCAAVGFVADDVECGEGGGVRG